MTKPTPVCAALALAAMCTLVEGVQAGCPERPAEDPNPAASLKAAFKDHFLVGAALNVNQIMGQDPGATSLVAREFNALTAENATKWEKIHPLEDRFEWAVADALAEYAENHDMHLTGHVLVWHQQTPDWVFEDGAGNPATRELLLERMEHHISKVVGRYKGRIDAWEVVNEALNEDGSLRETPWLQIIGEDFIEQAFRFAHKADPEARLYYNDFNLYKPEKREGAVRIVHGLLEKGVPVHAVGMQGHYGLDYPEDLGQFGDSINAFAGLGLEVYITELDLSVLPFPDEESRSADLNVNLELSARLNPYAGGLPVEVEDVQVARYTDLFRIMLENSDSVERVTFWGVNDGQSWKNNWPMRGRTDYPLLFDRKNQPKRAYCEILELAASH